MHQLHAQTPRTFITPTLVALTVGYFGLMTLMGVHPLSPQGQDLVRFGANFGPLTTSGEWWRLLSSCFIHIGAMHIAFNMYVLWDVGRLVERILGNWGFLALYLTAGIGGSLASVWWNPVVISAGASGAVFGVFGALVGVMVRSRHLIPPSMLRGLGRSVAVLIGFNVLFGLSVKGIDNAAHLGGLFTGFLCALILGGAFTRTRGQRLASAALVAGLGGGLFVAAPALVPPDPTVQQRVAIDAEEKAVLAAFNQLVEQAQRGVLTDIAMADALAQDILPRWRAIRAQVDALDTEDERVRRYFALREKAWRKMEAGLRTGDEARLREAAETQAEADRLAGGG